MPNQYGVALREPHVVRSVVPYLVGRLPTGMTLLALLMLVQRQTGSFSTAGLVSASFAAGVSVTAPLLGRLVDARGQSLPLLVTGVLHPVSLLLLVALVQSGASERVLVTGALVSGGCLPPLSGCMRALWPTLLPAERLQATGYSLEVVVVELCELGGPLLVGALVALSGPAAAVRGSALLSALGVLVFAASPASRRWRGTRRTGSWTGPLAVPGVRWLLGVVLLSTCGLASLEVAVAAVATSHGRPGATGVLLGLFVVGSLLGGWAFGLRHWRATASSQLLVLLGLFVAGQAAAAVAPGLGGMAVVLVLAGAAYAPATSVQLTVMSRVAPQGCRTEAFTWAATANFLGIAIGNCVTGAVLHAAGERTALLAAAAPSAAALLVVLLGTRLLGGRRAAEQTVPLEVHLELERELASALAAVRATGARNDELAREVARLRQAAAEGGIPEQRRRAQALEEVRARLEHAVEELAVVDQRRLEVLADVQALQALLGMPDAKVRPLRGAQSSGGFPITSA